MATVTPNAPPTVQAVAAPASPPDQESAWPDFTPLQTASIVLGLLAVILFLGSLLLKRVALAPLDVQPENADR
jgi:hypothetical protein